MVGLVGPACIAFQVTNHTLNLTPTNFLRFTVATVKRLRVLGDSRLDWETKQALLFRAKAGSIGVRDKAIHGLTGKPNKGCFRDVAVFRPSVIRLPVGLSWLRAEGLLVMGSFFVGWRSVRRVFNFGMRGFIVISLLCRGVAIGPVVLYGFG